MDEDSLYKCRFDAAGGVWIFLAGDWVHFEPNSKRAEGPCNNCNPHSDGFCFDCTWGRVAHS